MKKLPFLWGIIIILLSVAGCRPSNHRALLQRADSLYPLQGTCQRPYRRQHFWLYTDQPWRSRSESDYSLSSFYVDEGIDIDMGR